MEGDGISVGHPFDSDGLESLVIDDESTNLESKNIEYLLLKVSSAFARPTQSHSSS